MRTYILRLALGLISIIATSVAVRGAVSDKGSAQGGSAPQPVPLSFTKGSERIQLQPLELNITSAAAPIVSVPAKPGVSARQLKVQPGLYFAKDISHTGTAKGASLTIAKTDSSDIYTISNIHSLGENFKISCTIDETTGAISIEGQKVGKDILLGDIYMVPIVITRNSDGSISKIEYSYTGQITGTINQEGAISLGSWGLMYKQDNQDKALDITESGLWKPATIKATAFDVKNNRNIEYALSIEQTGESLIDIYCLSGIYGEVLKGKLRPDNTIEIAPQQVYSNPLLGIFYIYPCEIKNNKVSVNTVGPLKGTATDASTITFGPWLLGAVNNPAEVVSYVFTDAVIKGNHGIKFPAKPQMSFNGNGTQTDPYLIKTAKDLNDLSVLVSSGNHFQGKYFVLSNDLDLTSVSSSYNPIGTSDHPFEGTFDGKGYSIKNLTFDGMGFAHVGIFGAIGASGQVKDIKFRGIHITNQGAYTGIVAGVNSGKIENCAVASSSVVSRGKMAGGIAGYMDSATASISHCEFSGSIRSMGSGGGIVGQATGIITDCISKANIIHNGYLSAEARDIAGIVGVLSKGSVLRCSASGTISDSFGMAHTAGLVSRLIDSEVAQSFSVAAVIGKHNAASEEDNFTGGLIAYARNSKVNDCFSAGTVRKNENSEFVGGLVGFLGVSYNYSTETGASMKNLTVFTNCYSSSQILSTSSNSKKGLYGSTYTSQSWTGESPEDACFKNCYFDKQISFYPDEKYGRLTKFFTSGSLPEGFSSEIWTSQSGKYPVLTFAKASFASQLASVALDLDDNNSASKVKKEFGFSTSSDITWKVVDGSTQTEDGKALKIINNKFCVKDIYAVASVCALSSDGWGAKILNLSVVPDIYEGEGTQESPYILRTIDDWVNLNYAVANVGQQHNGDFFALGSDIDFNFTERFCGLGFGKAKGASFGGNFDGNGFSIHKLKIDAVAVDAQGKAISSSSIPYTGLFGILNENGQIKNLNISSDCRLNHFTYGGSIAGVNLGIIENCRNYADNTSVGNYLGGIAGLNGATIRDCYNSGTITQGAAYAGGIAGFVNPEASISRSQNDGKIIGTVVNPANEQSERSAFGGIAGSTCGLIEYCVNHGTINSSTAVGGIAGSANNQFKNARVVNCLNIGTQETVNSTTERGAIVGLSLYSSVQSGNVYDASINVNGSTNNSGEMSDFGLSTDRLTDGKPINSLPTDIFDYKEGVYPTLKKFANEKAASALRSIYIRFADNQLRTNIRSNVELSKVPGISYTLATNQDFRITGTQLTVTPPQQMKVLTDTLTASLDGFGKVYYLGSVPTILDGNGTPDSPYLIRTSDDWNKLAAFMEESEWEFPNNNFRIENDIDFKGDSIKAIAVNGVKFMGYLDGNQRTIKNYVYENINKDNKSIVGPNLYPGVNIGLIGSLGAGATVSNLTLDGEFKAYGNVGGLVGQNFGILENITMLGKTSSLKANNVAGLVYLALPGSRIRNCVNKGEVSSAKSYASGIAHQVNQDAIVAGCANLGKLKATSSGLGGIAYICDGSISDSYNSGTFTSATGNVAGIVLTLGANGILKGCYNSSDIDMNTTGSTIAGIFNVSSGSKTHPAVGYVEDCYNTGNLKGKTKIHGLFGNVASGLRISNCYNTGDIEATASRGLATGLTGRVEESIDEAHTIIEDCYNSGNVTGHAAKCAGLVNEARPYSFIRNCYNLGDVVATGHTDLALGGIAGRVQGGNIENCFNIGNITSSGNAVGGIAGYVATTGTDEKYGTVINCYNVGNITSTYTGIQKQGNAGGILGYISSGRVIMKDCINMGTVTAPKLVGGLAGGILDPISEVVRCFNSGKVICTGDDPKSWSGTVVRKSINGNYNGESIAFDAFSSDVYYDCTVNPGEGNYPFTDSQKTSEELAAMDFGENFVKHELGGYPALKLFAEKLDGENICHSMLQLSTPQENFERISTPFRLIAPPNSVWHAIDPATGAPSELLDMSEDTVKPLADGNVILKVSDANGIQSKEFVLSLKPSLVGIENIDANNEIKHVKYVNLEGIEISSPVPGEIYIQIVEMTNGNVSTQKVIYK